MPPADALRRLSTTEEDEPEVADERTLRRRNELLINGEDGERRVLPWSGSKAELAGWIANHAKLRGKPKTIAALTTAFDGFDGASLLSYLDRTLVKPPTPTKFEEATARLRRRLRRLSA